MPTRRADYAQALDMLKYAESLPVQIGPRIVFRTGINSGALVTRVIGKYNFHYDLWGDTVNTASRMESSGVPGKIQITKDKSWILIEE